MAFTPISNAVIQYAKDAAGTSASGYYLKFYASGTSTPFSMASASDGSGLLAKCQINSLGYPINGSGDVFIPHVNQDYRIVLYPTSADADSNTFANAVYDVDGVVQSDNGLRSDLAASNGELLIGSFNNVADALAGITASDAGKKVSWLGYYAASDGGSGWGIVRTGTHAADGGRILSANASLYIEQNINGSNWRTSIKKFGAQDGGDITTIAQKLVDAALIVSFPAESYTVSGTVNLRTGQDLKATGCTITQTASNTEIFNFESKSNINVTGFTFVGKGTDYLESDSSRAVAIFGGTSGSNIDIHNNTFNNFAYATVRFKSQSNCKFRNNRVTGPDATVITSSAIGRNYGVLVDSGCSHVLIKSNVINQGAQGIRLEQSNNVVITGNNIYNILGQHGIYAGSNLQEIVISNNVINDTRLQGIKVQAQDSSGADNTNIVIKGNTLQDCTDQAIFVGSSESPAVQHCRNVVISGNAIDAPGGQGVYTDSLIGGIISGNTIRNAGQSGIVLDEVDDVLVDHNLIIGSVNSGIRDIAACNNITIKNNIIKDCATGNTVGDEYGIYIQGVGSEFVIDGNVITDSLANMERAIYLAADINATTTLTNNICPNSTGGGLRLAATTAFRKFSGNVFNGSFNNPVLPSIASSSTIVLPQGADVVQVTGTTGISAITASGHSGRRVTLVFTGALTLTDGAALRLAGNYTTAANGTLTLVSDGTGWFEVCRSAN